MADLASIVHSDPEILGGRSESSSSTSLPGDSLDEFLDAFPSVKREQAAAALEVAGDLLVTGSRASR
jgi:hypothetical protein